MQRQSRYRRQRERINRVELRRRKRVQAVAIGAVSCLAIIGFGALAMSYHQVDIDQTTGCPTNAHKPAAHTAVLVDETDKLSPSDLSFAKSLIRTEYINLPVGGQLTIRNIVSDPDQSRDIVVCRMATNASPGDINSNDRKIKKDFEKIAGVRLDHMIDALATAEQQNESPIKETIAALVDEPSFSSAVQSRRLVVLSDLLQHSSAASDYRRVSTIRDNTNSAFDRDMQGVTVRLQYIRRPAFARLQGPDHRARWRAYFARMGATDVAVGHDLALGEGGKWEVWIDGSS